MFSEVKYLMAIWYISKGWVLNYGDDGDYEGIGATDHSRKASAEESLQQSVYTSHKQQCLHYSHLVTLHLARENTWLNDATLICAQK